MGDPVDRGGSTTSMGQVEGGGVRPAYPDGNAPLYLGRIPEDVRQGLDGHWGSDTRGSLGQLQPIQDQDLGPFPMPPDQMKEGIHINTPDINGLDPHVVERGHFLDGLPEGYPNNSDSTERGFLDYPLLDPILSIGNTGPDHQQGAGIQGGDVGLTIPFHEKAVGLY